MTGTGLHISIAAEEVFNLGGLSVSNSILTSVLVSTILILFALMVRLQLQDTNNPKGLQNFAEWLVESLHNLVHGITNNKKKTKQFMPWVATFFLFILLNNWLGLMPGVGTIGFIENEGEVHAQLQPSNVELEAAQAYAQDEHGEVMMEADEHAADEQAVKGSSEDGHASEESAEEESHGAFVPLFRPGTADLNTTLALALLSVTITQVFGVMHLGLGYFKKYINFSSPIMFFVGILEIISEFAKIVSFAFRLFGNIFAGEVLLVVIAFLIPLLAPLPFYGLEVFVGFIQALVFAMLSLVFFNIATQSHDDH